MVARSIISQLSARSVQSTELSTVHRRPPLRILRFPPCTIPAYCPRVEAIGRDLRQFHTFSTCLLNNRFSADGSSDDLSQMFRSTRYSVRKFPRTLGESAHFIACSRGDHIQIHMKFLAYQTGQHTGLILQSHVRPINLSRVTSPAL